MKSTLIIKIKVQNIVLLIVCTPLYIRSVELVHLWLGTHLSVEHLPSMYETQIQSHEPAPPPPTQTRQAKLNQTSSLMISISFPYPSSPLQPLIYCDFIILTILLKNGLF